MDVGAKHYQSQTARELIERSMSEYFVAVLGWTAAEARKRIDTEIVRSIPASCLDWLTERGWAVDNRRVLDVGCGHGGLVLELSVRGANAIGVEPSRESASIAERRLEESGYAGTILCCDGRSIDLPAGSIDYAISLQVLEHTKNPEMLVQEVFRLLKPGGQFYLSCENYLSFREQHYRVFWLPLLPKPIGAIYLRLRGRDPDFLHQHVVYTTYPAIRRMCVAAGFKILDDVTHFPKLDHPDSIGRPLVRRIVKTVLFFLGADSTRKIATRVDSLLRFFRVGVRLRLSKPAQCGGLRQ